MRIKNTTTFDVWSFPTREPLPQTNEGTRVVSLPPSAASSARLSTIKTMASVKSSSSSCMRKSMMSSSLSSQMLFMFLEIKILWQHTPITDHLTSVTIYSKSIRDNILLANLLFEGVELAKKRGARIWSRRENSSILLNSRSPNQISSLSGAKCKVSSPCGAMHFGQKYHPKRSSWVITQISLQGWGCSKGSHLVRPLGRGHLDKVHVRNYCMVRQYMVVVATACDSMFCAYSTSQPRYFWSTPFPFTIRFAHLSMQSFLHPSFQVSKYT